MAHKLLDGVAATGASSSIFLAYPTSQHTMICYYTDADASISALTIALQASDDPRSVADASAHWYTLYSYAFQAADITAKQAMVHVVDKPVKRVRLNITTLTGAGAGDLVYARYVQGKN